MSHKPFPPSVKLSVLMKCRRRCALCYGLNNDFAEQRGQLAHIDRDGENIDESNAAWLCTHHHDIYDSTSRQTTGFLPGELKAYQETLLAYVTTIRNKNQDETASPSRSPEHATAVTLEVHDRRIPIYRITRQFVRDVASDLRPGLQLILKFAADTDEALFLFDDSLAKYLETLFTNALRLHTTELQRERMQTHPDEAFLRLG